MLVPGEASATRGDWNDWNSTHSRVTALGVLPIKFHLLCLHYVWVCGYTCKVCMHEGVCCVYEQQILDSILTWPTPYMVDTSTLTAIQCLCTMHAHMHTHHTACEVATQCGLGDALKLWT